MVVGFLSKAGMGRFAGCWLISASWLEPFPVPQVGVGMEHGESSGWGLLGHSKITDRDLSFPIVPQWKEWHPARPGVGRLQTASRCCLPLMPW